MTCIARFVLLPFAFLFHSIILLFDCVLLSLIFNVIGWKWRTVSSKNFGSQRTILRGHICLVFWSTCGHSTFCPHAGQKSGIYMTPQNGPHVGCGPTILLGQVKHLFERTHHSSGLFYKFSLLWVYLVNKHIPRKLGM